MSEDQKRILEQQLWSIYNKLRVKMNEIFNFMESRTIKFKTFY